MSIKIHFGIRTIIAGYKAGQVVIPAAASLLARTKANEAMVGFVGSFVAGVIAEHAGATAYNLSSVYAGPIGAATTVVAVSAKDFIRDVYVENAYGLDAEDLADAAIEYSEKLLEDGFVDIKTNELPIPPVRPSTMEMVNVTQRRQPRQTVGLFDSASSDSLFSSTSSDSLFTSTSSSTQELSDSTQFHDENLEVVQK